MSEWGSVTAVTLGYFLGRNAFNAKKPSNLLFRDGPKLL